MRRRIRAALSAVSGAMLPVTQPEPALPLRDLRLDVEGQAASDHIARLLEGGGPCMVARFGSVELDAVMRWRYIHKTPFSQRVANYLAQSRAIAWNLPACQPLSINAGFFPIEPAFLERFGALMVDAMRSVDVLGSWVPGESQFSRELAQARTCELADLEPYYHARPWSRVLAGRRVLVVHPFEETIRTQFATRRADLFANPDVLPPFELLTVRAVQSSARNPTRFASWFEALDWMTEQVQAVDFDTAIVGCGAYGFPLAARIKAMGRQAVHLGGATQYLFGIRSRRGEEMPQIARFFNAHWVRPSRDETPVHAELVENACYW